MKFKRTFSIMAVFVAIVALASGCHRGPWGSDSLSERVIDHLDSHVEDLDLNENQTVQYEEIKSRLTIDLDKTQAEHKAFKQSIRTIATQEDATVKDITTEVRFKLNELPTKASVYLDYVDELWGVLDEKQQAIVMTEMREQSEGKSRWHKRHERRHEKRQGRMFHHFDEHVEDLELTPEQNAKYEDLKNRVQAHVSAQKDEHVSVRDRMKELLANENTGLNDMTIEARTMLNEMPDKAGAYLDFIDEMWDILDERQQAMVMEEVQDRVDSRWFD